MGVSGAARTLGVSRTCVYNWLKGARTPSQKLRTRISRVSKGKVDLRRACIEIDRGKWPIECYPDRD